MKKTISSAILTSCLIGGGCATSLDIQPMQSTSQEGVPYVLPFTQYDITIIRRVNDCSKNNIELGIDVSVIPKMVDDPAQAYLIDPESLASFFNRSNFSIEYFENTYQVKSLTAKVEDQVLPFVAKAVTTAAKLLTIPAGAGGAGKSCSLVTATAVDDVKSTKGDVEKKTGEIRANTIELEELSKSRESLGIRAPHSITARIIKLRGDLDADMKKLTILNKKLIKELKAITSVDKRSWPKNGDKITTHLRMELDRKILDKWTRQPIASIPPEIVQNFDVFFTLTPDSVLSDWVSNSVALTRADAIRDSLLPSKVKTTLTTAHITNDGMLPYRIGVPGTITAYAFQKPISGPKAAEKVELIEKKGTILQMGRMLSFPVKAKAFESRNTGIVFDKTGGLVSAKIERSAAPSEALGNFSESAATQYAAIKKFENEAEKAAADTAKSKEQAELDAEIKRLQSLKTLAELQEELSDEDSQRLQSIEVMASETSLLQAEIALLEARKALEALK